MTDTPTEATRFESPPPTREDQAVVIPFDIVAWTQPGPLDDMDTFEPKQHSVHFRARSNVPMGYLLDIAAMIEVMPNGTQRLNMAPYNRVMNAILWSDEDRTAYYDLMHDPALFIHPDTLASVAQFLATAIAGRPTGQSST